MVSYWQVRRNNRNIQTKMFSTCFSPSASQFRSEIDKKASPERSNIDQKNRYNFDAIFDQCLSQPVSVLRRLWRPSWNPSGTRWHQNMTQKPINKKYLFLLHRLRIYFDWILKFNLGDQGWLGGVQQWLCSVFFWLLGLFRGQDGPKKLQGSLQGRFWSELHSF